MKRDLTIAVLCSVVLWGCSPQAKQDFSDNVNDGLQDTKEAAAAVTSTAQSQASEASRHAEYFGNAAEEGFYSMTDHIADWMKPSVPKPPQPIAASYCYHVYEDILCYRRPMPDAQTRLAGYQPPNAPPPPVAVTQPLPKPVADASQLPANRVAAARPVFSKMPGPPAESGKAPEDGAVVPEMTHEQLPDPASAPEL